MTPEAIKQLVVATINSQMSPYAPARVPSHTHNGQDSQRVYLPFNTYVGAVSSDLSHYSLPAGWTIQHPGPGEYVIHHYLNNENYSVSPTINTDDFSSPTIPTIGETLIAFSVIWFAPDGMSTVDTGFYFSLTVSGNLDNTNQKIIVT